MNKKTIIIIAVVALLVVVGVILVLTLGNNGGTTYTITYELNGGTNNADNPTSYNGKNNIAIKNPVRQGYVFTGWTDGPDGELELNYIIAKGASGDLTLTANWREAQKFTLTVNSGIGGTANPTSGQYFEGEAVTVTATPNTGYKFDGWFETATSKSLSASYTFNMPANNLALEARFSLASS